MSVSLQERRERAEGRIESLLSGMDETVRQVYESLLERGADYRELTPEKEVARLEGFHDYILTRDETGVDHPSLTDYLETKKKFGNEMLSFGTGKHRDVETAEENHGEQVAYVEEPYAVEEDHDDEEVVAEDVHEELPSFLADEDEPAEELHTDDWEDDVDADTDEESDETEEVVEESEPEAEETVEESNADEDADDATEEQESTWGSVFDDEDEVVINPTASNEVVEAPKADVQDEPVVASTANRINERVIIDQEFATKLGGYNIDEVDESLDLLADFFKGSHSGAEYVAKADEVSKVTFSKKSFKKGFATNEVEEFMEAVVQELRNRAQES